MGKHYSPNGDRDGLQGGGGLDWGLTAGLGAARSKEKEKGELGKSVG